MKQATTWGRDPWIVTSVAITAALALAAALAGFIWLPMLETGARFAGVWDAICSAAGLITVAPANAPVVQASYTTTQVELTPGMLRGSDAESIGRGATLARRCAMCHGAQGVSQADWPNLAGQYPVAIYKQLQDFKSGARASAMMQPLVADLSSRDMRDLAVYYASLPRLPAYHPASAGPPPQIVASGAPMRNIASCGACHGALDHKEGSPWLEGQPAAYIDAQLRAFASGARHNDINEQMRNVARQMVPSEIAAAARYYAGQPQSGRHP